MYKKLLIEKSRLVISDNILNHNDRRINQKGILDNLIDFIIYGTHENYLRHICINKTVSSTPDGIFGLTGFHGVNNYTRLVRYARLREKTFRNVGFIFYRSTLLQEKVILTDKGTAFEPALFTHFCKFKDIHKLHSTAYHQATNGLLERTNKSIKEISRTIVEEDPKSRDNNLEKVLLAFRKGKKFTN
ncbi:hypothetical protein RF11_13433 [Thelohanellus kitauei]|uniref:Integrase catalytic domain-containing protein n=1 Tax=Thelohanellus kitauei TaxID=669202 RepID=A0A0C2MU39_THEKT|nr:hypothetical protein RF11_13433 [Thelohanellus kitauei]